MNYLCVAIIFQSCVLGSVFSVLGESTNLKSELFRLRREAVPYTAVYSYNGNQQQAAVDAHNTARRRVSPGAADMTEMTWDQELAKTALDYSKKCIFGHSQAPSDSRFNRIGENIHISEGATFSSSFVSSVVEYWENEKYDYNYNTGACSGVACGHYTQVVWASSFKVGCGSSKCKEVPVTSGDIYRNAIITVCNYAYAGNYEGEKPYKTGSPCSACEDTSDSCSNGLCSNPNRVGNAFQPTTRPPATPPSQFGPDAVCSSTTFPCSPCPSGFEKVVTECRKESPAGSSTYTATSYNFCTC